MTGKCYRIATEVDIWIWIDPNCKTNTVLFRLEKRFMSTIKPTPYGATKKEDQLDQLAVNCCSAASSQPSHHNRKRAVAQECTGNGSPNHDISEKKFQTLIYTKTLAIAKQKPLAHSTVEFQCIVTHVVT
uniref:Uncharacterized protein n=1 Tax=Glossina austeni TaxID=7395 RepID=A0A1A9US05_GLOAU